MSSSIIYLDNNSTTRTDERVIEAMLPFFRDIYSNASSNHKFGNQAREGIEKARENVADLIGAEKSEIIFTSGATEAINLGIKGFALSSYNKRKKIITVSTEHKAVIETCNYLENIGYEVVFLPVQKDGLLDIDVVAHSIDNNTLFVAVMFVNNETGVIQPVKEISDLAHKNGAYFFCDATQAVGKIEVNVRGHDIDMLSISAHKFYGPKGIGALYINNQLRKELNFFPILLGGGQEDGLRSGTLNVPGIIGLGEAAKISKSEMTANEAKISILRDTLEHQLLDIEGVFVNGSKKNRIYNTSNICFPGVDSSVLIGLLDNISVSNGSACSSRIVEPSHVLIAMGLASDNVAESIRFSLSKYNTLSEVDICVTEIQEKIKRLS